MKTVLIAFGELCASAAGIVSLHPQCARSVDRLAVRCRQIREEGEDDLESN